MIFPLFVMNYVRSNSITFYCNNTHSYRSKSVQLTGNGIDTNGLAEAMNEIVRHNFIGLNITITSYKV
jgi:hypothetical protein